MKELPGAGGFRIPEDVDGTAIDRIRKLAATRSNGAPVPWRAFAAAWNGLAHRFRAADDFNTEFVDAMRAGDAPAAEERYTQERALFGFACAAVSTLECFYFAVYCVGALVRPEMFPVNKDRDLRFYPADVRDAYLKALPDEQLTERLATALAAEQWTQLCDLRNVLSHRGNLPRAIHMSVGTEPTKKTGAFVPSNPTSLSSEWLFDRTIDANLTQSLRGWMGVVLAELLASFVTFAERTLGADPNAI